MRGPANWYKGKSYVNAQLCWLRQASKNVGYMGKYVTIRTLDEGGYLSYATDLPMIPMDQMPSSATMFTLNDAGSFHKTFLR